MGGEEPAAMLPEQRPDLLAIGLRQPQGPDGGAGEKLKPPFAMRDRQRRQPGFDLEQEHQPVAITGVSVLADQACKMQVARLPLAVEFLAGLPAGTGAGRFADVHVQFAAGWAPQAEIRLLGPLQQQHFVLLVEAIEQRRNLVGQRHGRSEAGKCPGGKRSRVRSGNSQEAPDGAEVTEPKRELPLSFTAELQRRSQSPITPRMNAPPKAVERLYPFALRARIVVPGREAMAHQQGRLLFVLITTDLSAKSRERIQHDFGQLPIVECYTSAQVESFFAFRGTKVLGFRRSTLAQAILKELKAFRLPPPAVSVAQPAVAGIPGAPVAPPASVPTSPPAAVQPVANSPVGPGALPGAMVPAGDAATATAVLPAPTVELGWRARQRLRKTARTKPQAKTPPPKTP